MIINHKISFTIFILGLVFFVISLFMLSEAKNLQHANFQRNGDTIVVGEFVPDADPIVEDESEVGLNPAIEESQLELLEAEKEDLESRLEIVNLEIGILNNGCDVVSDALKAECLERQQIILDDKIITKALDNKDTQICQELNNENTQDSCVVLVNQAMIKETYLKAISENNIDICAENLEGNLQFLCEEEFQNKLDLEEQIAIVRSGEIGKCQELRLPKNKENCANNIRTNNDMAFLEEAIKASDINLCQQINDPKLRLSCEKSI